MSALLDELIDILNGEKLTPHFQPIVSLKQQEIIGYEALIRGAADNSLYSPVALFNAAKSFNLSAKLEFICLKIILQRYAGLNSNKKLFVNLSPWALLENVFKTSMTLEFFDQICLAPQSIVIELTEHQPVEDYPLMIQAVTHCRNMGFEIALDDFGSGYSGLRVWSELLPEYVKIDKHFITGLDNDPIKLNFVRSIQTIANALDCYVIAEGIETENEANAVMELGISHAQGYYFAKPTALPLEKIDNALFIYNGTEKDPLHLFDSILPLNTADKTPPIVADCCPANAACALDIVKRITPVSADTTITEVMQLFQLNRELAILPLVDNKVVSGLVFRDRFLSRLFTSRYGIDLYGKKPIKIFVEKMPLTVEQHLSIELVSRQLTTTSDADPAFVVTQNGEYLGIATVLDLLEEITRQKIKHAKHANPLTLLPGSVPVNEYINQLLANNQPFSVGYFDLDNFKPFNDVYGYNAGDDMIKAVAELLTEYIAKYCGTVGHIGGDDFIVVFTCNDWFRCCKEVLVSFGEIVPRYYSEQDRKAGGIYAENRSGERCFFPMVSLSVGIVDPASTQHCQSHVDIADLASGAKKQAKKIAGNSFFINQRIAKKSHKHYHPLAS
ncbi:MAG: EAL and GGDEF domain-containing protein [Methylovulum sp.]|nr:EAL and GGDEF domain-containing protein [Methylovulum sp.]